MVFVNVAMLKHKLNYALEALNHNVEASLWFHGALCGRGSIQRLLIKDFIGHGVVNT